MKETKLARSGLEVENSLKIHFIFQACLKPELAKLTHSEQAFRSCEVAPLGIP